MPLIKKLHQSKPLLFPILLVLYEIATYLSNDMYLPALPDMMKDINLSLQQAQLTLTTWFVGAASMPLIMGVVSERFGRRPVLLIGGVIYILATIACAITSNNHFLLIARFIEGAAIPSMTVAGYACIHELFDQKEAIRILALMGSITVLAPALGPLLGSIVLYLTSWRGIFWFIACLALIAIALLTRWMPETHPPEKRHPIHLGVLLKQYGRALCTKKFMFLMLVIGFNFIGFIVWITASPLLLIDTFHYSPFAFGIVQAIVFGAYIFGNYWVKYILEWAGVKKLIYIGLSISLLGGVLAFGAAYFLPHTIYPILFAMTVYSFGSALSFAPLNRMIIEACDEPMGVRMALFTVLWNGFAVLGSLISSIFFNGTIGSVAYPLTIAIIISCVLKMVAGD